MSKRCLSSLRARFADKLSELTEETRARLIRRQTATVRALTDELERLYAPLETNLVGLQLVEELVRLGCQIYETAAALSPRTQASMQSAILRESWDNRDQSQRPIGLRTRRLQMQAPPECNLCSTIARVAPSATDSSWLGLCKGPPCVFEQQGEHHD
jgi:hypothetical protein